MLEFNIKKYITLKSILDCTAYTLVSGVYAIERSTQIFSYKYKSLKRMFLFLFLLKFKRGLKLVSNYSM